MAAYLLRCDDWGSLDMDRYGETPVGGLSTAELEQALAEPAPVAAPGIGTLDELRREAEEYRDSVGYETPARRTGPLPADPDPDEGQAI